MNGDELFDEEGDAAVEVLESGGRVCVPVDGHLRLSGTVVDGATEFRYVDNPVPWNQKGYNSGDDIFSIHADRGLYTKMRDNYIAHEVGHAIEMVHRDASGSVMSTPLGLSKAGGYRTAPEVAGDPDNPRWVAIGDDFHASNQNKIQLK